MHVRITNVLHLSPSLFWQRLFFDAEYNRGLYRALGFAAYEVQTLETSASGCVRRVLRAVPPVKAPNVVRKRLEGRLYYLEDGSYDPSSALWTFKSEPSLAPESTKITGTIHAEPDAGGMLHVAELSIEVSAFGLGALIERAIERNTRESYRLMAEYTNAFVMRPDFSP